MAPKKITKKPEPEEEEEVEEMEEGEDEEEEEEVLPGSAMAHAYLNSINLTVRNRAFGLRKLHQDFIKTKEELHGEVALLDAKYADLYKPLNDKRREIIQGKVEPTKDEISAGSKIMEITDVEEDGAKEEKPLDGPKGIPKFWLTALTNCEETVDLLSDRDQEVLEFLEDIEMQYLPKANDGFKLVFHFAENSFFSNTELTKTYFYSLENGELMVDKSEGTKIEWKSAEKNVTIKQVKKRKARGKVKKTVVVDAPCPSFFRYFESTEKKEGAEKEDEEGEDEALQKEEEDLEVTNVIRDKVIPFAVNYYTGEATASVPFDFGGLDDDDDEDDDEEEEKPKKKAVQAKGGAPAQQDCKQQ